MEQVEFENYVPFCTDNVLRVLYRVKDALCRKSYKEAQLHIGDVLAEVQNEIDWCHRTDPVAAQYRDFLLQLLHAVDVIQNVAPSHVRDVLQETISVVVETQQEIAERCSGLPRWPAPGPSVDALERNHRAYTYRYNVKP